MSTFTDSAAQTQAPRAAQTPTRPRHGAAPLQRVDSMRLLGGNPAIVIEHAGQEYQLRLTRNDKLILTK